MEHLGVFSDENWSSFAAAMPIEEYDMAHLLGSYEFDQDPSYLTSNLDPSLCYWPQGDCSGSNGFGFIGAPPSQHGSCNASDSILVPAIDDFSKPAEFVLAEEQMNTATPSLQVVPSQSIGEDCEDHSMEITEGIVPPIQNSQLKAEFEPSDKDDDASVLSPKKRVRASLQIKRSNKKAKTKREQKSLSTDGEEGQSSSCNSFDDDSNAMGELNSGGCGVSSNSLNLNGKTRASRGTATDPQSLYARKRRERINERLRILQNLVPNGTKVDISTMLEEAVQYVKFLQLQIKLLSSDELWMYAPIAYNGMNIGLDLNISPPKP